MKNINKQEHVFVVYLILDISFFNKSDQNNSNKINFLKNTKFQN